VSAEQGPKEPKTRHTLADHLHGQEHEHGHDGDADHDHDHDHDGPPGPL